MLVLQPGDIFIYQGLRREVKTVSKSIIVCYTLKLDGPRVANAVSGKDTFSRIKTNDSAKFKTEWFDLEITDETGFLMIKKQNN